MTPALKRKVLALLQKRVDVDEFPQTLSDSELVEVARAATVIAGTVIGEKRPGALERFRRLREAIQVEWETRSQSRPGWQDDVAQRLDA